MNLIMLAKVDTLTKHGHTYNIQVLYLKIVGNILQEMEKMFPIAEAHVQVGSLIGKNINQVNIILLIQSIKSNKKSIPMDQSKLVFWSTLTSCHIIVEYMCTLQDL